MSSDLKLTKDEEYESLDSTKYRGMIEAPKTSHLEAVKRIFRYIKGTTYLGLWYPKGTDIKTVVYADSDHAGDYVDRKSTSDICTFVGCCLTSWFSKKQTALAISTTEAEYTRKDRGMRRGRHSTSSSSAFDQPSSSHLIDDDDDDDDDENDEGTSRASTPSPTHFINSLTNKGNVDSTSEDGNALCCEAAIANEGRKRFADVDIQNKIMKIIKGALVVMRGEKVAANLYQLKGEIMEEAEASVASHSPSHRVSVICYQMLRHMSKQGLKILVERKLFIGLTKDMVYPINKKSDVFEVFKAGRNQKAVHNGIHSSTEWSGKADEQNLVRKSESNVGNCKLQKIILDLHIFGSLVYMMCNSQETTKLDPKSRKCSFLGNADGVNGYRLWGPTAHKVVFSRDVVFMEDKIHENEEGDSTTRETTSIQMEKEFQSNDSFEVEP
uniref:Copia protein n=1 Tax=Tanacetum cinerariifolium TaxID=118510 RepID=A0A6L2LDI7_TANCI|nr:copia protein [Tanacetum cinerariifolium]